MSKSAQRGRTRAPWRLTSTGLYDRYGRALIPAWLAWLMGAVLVAALAWLVYTGQAPTNPGDAVRALALLFPFAAALVVILVRSETDPDE